MSHARLRCASIHASMHRCLQQTCKASICMYRMLDLGVRHQIKSSRQVINVSAAARLAGLLTNCGTKHRLLWQDKSIRLCILAPCAYDKKLRSRYCRWTTSGCAGSAGVRTLCAATSTGRSRAMRRRCSSSPRYHTRQAGTRSPSDAVSHTRVRHFWRLPLPCICMHAPMLPSDTCTSLRRHAPVTSSCADHSTGVYKSLACQTGDLGYHRGICLLSLRGASSSRLLRRVGLAMCRAFRWLLRCPCTC